MALHLLLHSASFRVLAVLLSASCSRGDTPEDDTGPTHDTEGTAPQGFTVRGTVRDTFTREPAAEGLCVYVGDPTCELGQGEFFIIAEGLVGVEGAYEVSGIVTRSMSGLFMLVQDCADEGSVMPTATGMPASVYDGLNDGDVIAGFDIECVDSAHADGLQDGLAKAGYTRDLRKDGALLGFVVDAEGAPIDGAVIGVFKGLSVYYWNGTGFGFGGTVAAAGAMFTIPRAPIYAYSCTATGYTFDTQLVGSHYGYVVRSDFVAM